MPEVFEFLMVVFSTTFKTAFVNVISHTFSSFLDQDEDRPTTANEEADDVKDDGNTEEGEKGEEEDYDTDIPITNLGPGAESLSHQEIAV